MSRPSDSGDATGAGACRRRFRFAREVACMPPFGAHRSAAGGCKEVTDARVAELKKTRPDCTIMFATMSKG
jgi:hypothetical protein